MTAPSPDTAGGLPPGVSLDTLMDAAQHSDGAGFCLDCGAENGGVEPDASGYPCEICGALRVAGAEQILLGSCVTPDRRAAALVILAATWTQPAFRHARSFCVGLDTPEDVIAAMERGYRPAVRRDLMGDRAAELFIATWDAAAEALGVASRAHVCMPKGAPPAGDDDLDAGPTAVAPRARDLSDACPEPWPTRGRPHGLRAGGPRSSG